MSFVVAGVAVGGSAAIGVGGSIWSGMVQRDAAKESAAAMEDASRRAESGLNARQNQALALLAPFMRPGSRAGDTLSRLVVSPQERKRQSALERADMEANIAKLSQGISWENMPLLTGKNASERRESMWKEQEGARKNQLTAAQQALTDFDKRVEIEGQFGDEPIQNSPLYDWQMEQGTKYLDRSLARKGLRGSGEGVKLLGDFVRGLGAEESERQVGRLMNLFNTGANAASGSANLLQAFAPQIAQTQISQGDARARGILGAGEATSNMITGSVNQINGAVGNYLQFDMFKRLMNKNSGGGSRGVDPVMDSTDVWSTLPTRGATPYDYLRSGRA